MKLGRLYSKNAARPTLGQDEHGGVLIFFAFSLLMLIAILGISIDMARMYHLHMQVRSATQIAAFVANKTLGMDCRKQTGLAIKACVNNPATAVSVFEKRFKEFFEQNYFTKQPYTSDVTARNLSQQEIEFTVTVRAELTTIFIAIVGIDQLEVQYVTKVSKKIV